MERLREKLHSQRGASILLALLFFLLCMMVAASILMAAASNAGKIRSSYEEQQKYLTLSSALRLVAGQLEQAEYRGSYSIYRWDVITEDEEGREITTKYYHIQQKSGSFGCGKLDGVLTFQKELDYLFSKEFPEHNIAYSSSFRNPPPSFNKDPSYIPPSLSVAVDGSDPELQEKFPAVTVEAEMDESRRIHLTATLKESDAKVYRMEAELSAQGVPAIEFSPEADEFPLDSPPGGAAAVPVETELVTWKLDWIAKEVAGG